MFRAWPTPHESSWCWIVIYHFKLSNGQAADSIILCQAQRWHSAGFTMCWRLKAEIQTYQVWHTRTHNRMNLINVKLKKCNLRQVHKISGALDSVSNQIYGALIHRIYEALFSWNLWGLKFTIFWVLSSRNVWGQQEQEQQQQQRRQRQPQQQQQLLLLLLLLLKLKECSRDQWCSVSNWRHHNAHIPL